MVKVCATVSQETPSKVPLKSQKQAKRRKQTVGSHNKVTAMETLAEPSALINHLYYPTRHDLFPKLDPYNYQLLQGYPNYSAFPQIPNNYSWMVNPNAAFQSSEIAKRESVFEAPNIPDIKTSLNSTQHKLLPEPSSVNHKERQSTSEDHKHREKSAEQKEEIKHSDAIKSQPCFPIRKSSNGSPAETSSLHLPRFNSSSETTFGKSKISKNENFNGKCEDNISDSDFCKTVPKRKKLSANENGDVTWTRSNQSIIHDHKLHSPILSSTNSLKPTPGSPATVLSLPSPANPISTTPSWKVAPNGPEIALTAELALGNLQYPFVPPQPSMYNVNTAEQATSWEEDVFYCHMCDYSGKSKPEFDAHMNTHFEYNCPHCDYTSRTEGRLKRHIKDFHSENGTRRHLSGKSKIFKCKSCTFSTTEREEFWNHSRTHIKEGKLLQCPHCSFVTEYKHHLVYHISNHTGSKPFKCKKCNYTCVNRSMLNSHMKSHTKVYPYRCSDCTYATKYPHSLKLHLKKHKHRQAVALNLDGSFPKVVSENKLSRGSKSQLPTEKLDIRNDIINPYLSHMFGMQDVPIGMPLMTSGLNNMMPFWPMLHSTSMQTGMLADTLMFNQLMGAGAVNKVGSEMESESKDVKTNEKEESDSKTDNTKLVCALCNRTFKDPEALYHHILQMHDDITKENSNINGEISRDKLTRSSSNQDFKKHPQLYPLNEPGDQTGKKHQQNSGSDIYPRVKPQYPNDQGIQKAESVLLPSPIYPDRSGCRNKLEDKQNVAVYDKKNKDSKDPTSRADSRQQVSQISENCEPEKTSKEKIVPNEHTAQGGGLNIQNTATDFKNNFDFQCSSTALDLSQRKSSNVFRKMNLSVVSDNAAVPSNLRNEVKSRSKVAALLSQKHTSSDGENVNSQILADEITMPRKRSRKGIAYRLDPSRLKRGKTETDTFYDQAEFVTDQDRILKSIDRETFNETNKEFQDCKPRVISYPKHVTSENNVQLSDENVQYLEVRNLEKDMQESYMKNKREMSHNTKIKKETEIKDSYNINDETVENEKNYNLIFEEAEIELQKLRKHLCNQSERKETDSETHQAGIQLVNIHERENDRLRVGNCVKDQVREESANNGFISENADTVAHSEKFKDHFSQAEMRNSVIEKKEKIVCSPVKKNADHLWRTIRESVIPTSSEVLPINSHSQTGMSSSGHQGSLPELLLRDNHPSSVHCDIKSSDVLPYFSHPQLFDSSQSNPNARNSDMIMKPSAKLQASSPPKAYIHPTNRSTHEPTPGPLTSVKGQHEKKMYECTHCELSFGDCVMYTVHMGYHSSQDPFQCNNCGNISQDRVEFFLHMVRSSHV